MTQFDKRLTRLPEPWLTAVAEVCDSAFMAKVWFADHGLEASAADVLALTALILERKRDRENAA